MRVIPYVFALGLIIASGVSHGLVTGRWTASRVLEQRVAELRCVPRTIGDWEGQDSELDARTVQVSGMAGYLQRRYTDRSGGAVSVLIVCGLPGPISVHTPEVCYAGNGYQQTTEAAKVAIPGGAAERPEGFWSIDFQKPGPVITENLRVFYSWNADGVWSPAENPRYDYAGVPALYKMYVTRLRGSAETPGGADPAVEFLRQFLPVLRECLFSTSK